MEIRTTQHDGVGVIHLEGEVDQLALRDLKPAVDDLLTAGTDRLVFDLGSVTFVDSMGAAYLLLTCKRTRERQGDCLLAAVPPVVDKTFGALGMWEIFQKHDDAATAIAAANAAD